MTSRHVGSIVRLRPGLSRWHDTPIFRAGVTARFIGWVCVGWPITTLAATTLTAIVTVTVPVVVAGGWVLLVWAMITRTSLPQKLLGPLTLAVAAGYTWTQLTGPGQVAVGLLALFWPLDGLVDQYWHRYRVWRLWCEFRRGMPARFAIMAAKSTRIQGAIDGEDQLNTGERPALDHPALDLRATITGNTVTCRCSVSPGRNHHALREVVDELAASFPNVQHIDLVFKDEYQTFGHLIATFGPPTIAGQTIRGDRALSLLYQAIPHLVLAVGLALLAYLTIA